MVSALKTAFSSLVGLLVVVILSGCTQADYVDTINLDAGDAIAVNKAVHTIDPWPRHAFKKYHTTNGTRVSNGYGTYRGAREEPAKGELASSGSTAEDAPR